jgi:hypothetical protein
MAKGDIKRDALGRELRIGDLVLYFDAPYKGSLSTYFLLVVGFTDVSVKLSVRRRKYIYNTETRSGNYENKGFRPFDSKKCIICNDLWKSNNTTISRQKELAKTENITINHDMLSSNLENPTLENSLVDDMIEETLDL